MDDVLETMRSHQDEDDSGNEDEDDIEDDNDIAELEDADSDDDEEEIVTNDGRQCPCREIEKPDTHDGQHFEKPDKIKIVESKHDVFDTETT